MSEEPQPETEQDEQPAPPPRKAEAVAPLPIQMLHDRVLVDPDGDEGERRSTAFVVPVPSGTCPP